LPAGQRLETSTGGLRT